MALEVLETKLRISSQTEIISKIIKQRPNKSNFIKYTGKIYPTFCFTFRVQTSVCFSPRFAGGNSPQALTQNDDL
jgi:hypothetical protein